MGCRPKSISEISAGPGDLEIGFFDGAASTSRRDRRNAFGQQWVLRRYFRRRRSPAAPAAVAFFTDKAFNLGALATSGISPSTSV